MVTALILLGLGVWLVLALRAIRNGRTGGCCGDCEKCSRKCGKE